MLPIDTLEPIQAAARGAADKKAFHIVGIEVGELTSYTDAFLLCSAASDRQVAAIVDGVQRRLKESGRRPLHVEGEARSDWVLLDYGDFVVHVFTEERRTYYALDSLWGDAPRLSADQLGVDENPPT
ncbi:MAG: ribosome silencing factor [Thermoanaerobaculales bacterium]